MTVTTSGGLPAIMGSLLAASLAMLGFMGVAAYNGFKNQEEEFMALKKSERLRRTAELLEPILAGFREAHEKHHPGLGGFVSGLSLGLEHLVAEAAAAAHEEDVDADQKKREREASTKKFEEDSAARREYEESLSKQYQKNLAEEIERMKTQLRKDVEAEFAAAGAPPPMTQPPKAQRAPKTRGQRA